MKKDFENYLIKQGFAVRTASNLPSTVYDYMRGIKRVCREEKMTIEELAEHANKLVMKYQPIGESGQIGREYSRSVRCAGSIFSNLFNNVVTFVFVSFVVLSTS